jgi:cytochrome c oxidase subunit 3
MTNTADPAAEPQHPRHLAHHFETLDQQFESGKLGIWLFLTTEVLLFSGLFCGYAVYRANHPEIFAYAHLYLSKPLGTLNTLVLIFSSFTMASAVRAAQVGNTRWLVRLLAITLLCGFVFLGVKFAEYRDKWKEGLLVGQSYQPEQPPPGAIVPQGRPAEPPTAAATQAVAPQAAVEKQKTPAAEASSAGKFVVETSTIAPAAIGQPGIAHQWLARTAAPRAAWIGPEPNNVQVFFGIYFAMTGLHGLHVLAGMAVIAWMLLRARRGEFSPEYFSPVDFTGLYWHLVDLVWIFLFPLFYLIA